MPNLQCLQIDQLQPSRHHISKTVVQARLACISSISSQICTSCHVHMAGKSGIVFTTKIQLPAGAKYNTSEYVSIFTKTRQLVVEWTKTVPLQKFRQDIFHNSKTIVHKLIYLHGPEDHRRVVIRASSPTTSSSCELNLYMYEHPNALCSAILHLYSLEVSTRQLLLTYGILYDNSQQHITSFSRNISSSRAPNLLLLIAKRSQKPTKT